MTSLLLCSNPLELSHVFLDKKPQPDQGTSSAAATGARASNNGWWPVPSCCVLHTVLPQLRKARSACHFGRDTDRQTYYYYILAFEQMDWSHPDWQLLPARENPSWAGASSVWTSAQWPEHHQCLTGWALLSRHFQGMGNRTRARAKQAVLDRMQPAVRDLVVNQEPF